MSAEESWALGLRSSQGLRRHLEKAAGLDGASGTACSHSQPRES